MSDSLRPQRRFQLVLIKPSHYDDDGYVIQWFRSVMPSNSLAALYGLAIDAAERRVLGPDVSIDVTPIDETNTRIKPNFTSPGACRCSPRCSPTFKRLST